ncbi:PilN domain-containing protein [Vibrio brasiliensis]|uniref:Type IV pilus assembly protein PilN n=1 Tax=Vibrio brasiliensis LMG 20546 TaxID=945543 RepID=E8LYY0_9VIBR|nr:PilN domain-containing protein [Vibrio brasiliensis]EGA64100.1 type IV pilus assembly protein PilN [Vibrio brasiliensis LMG 20546]
MLYSVNLFPWREYQRFQHKLRFKRLMVVSVLLTIATQGVIGLDIDKRVEARQSDLERLNSELTRQQLQLSQLTEIEQNLTDLNDRIEQLSALNQQARLASQFITALPTYIPQSVYLDSLQLVDGKVKLVGLSKQTADIRMFIKRLETSAWVRQVVVHSLFQQNKRFGDGFHSFEISFTLASVIEQEG